MAFDPSTGLEGRVRAGAGNTVVAGIDQWEIVKDLGEIEIPHFESPADGDGLVWPSFEKGIAHATVNIKGIYNVDATDKTEGGANGLRLGATLSLDLLFVKGTPFGYLDVAGFVTKFQAGSTFANQPNPFTMTVRVTAAVGSAA